MGFTVPFGRLTKMPKGTTHGGVIWSSDPEATSRCPRCGRPSKGDSPCECLRGPYPQPEKQEARLLRSRQGRGGKTVVVIEGLRLAPEGYQELARSLRQALGTGGTIKDEVIEIQGDLRDRVADLLRKRGYRVKLVGG
jgi:translation initiation factor 1